jgi:hypothetical protein
VYKALVEELFNENLIRVRKGGTEGGRERGRACGVAACLQGTGRRFV